MNHLLNVLAVHHSRTLRDLKKERPDQVNLLVSKHNPGETLTAHKQATGTRENILRKMLTICSLSGPGGRPSSPSQKSDKMVESLKDSKKVLKAHSI